MQGHNFENKVQQNMDELRLIPSDVVWNKVELQIRKDKRRRRFLILLPLLALLIGTGITAWWMQQSPANSVIQTDKTTKNDSKNSVAAPPAADMPEAGSSEQDHREPGDLSKSPRQPKQDMPGPGTTASDHNQSHHTEEPVAVSREQAEKSLDASSAPEKSRSARSETVAQNPVYSLAVSGKRTTGKKSAVTDISNTVTGEIISPNQEGDAESASLKPAIPISIERFWNDPAVYVQVLADPLQYSSLKETSKPASTVIENKTGPLSPKWHWGFTAGAGVSKTVDGNLFGAFEKSLVMDAASFNTSSLAMPGPVGLPSRAGKPSAVKPGFSYSAGVFAERKLLKRVNLSAGLSYAYYSTSSEIGERQDSTLYINNTLSTTRVGAFYQNNPSEKYITRYHFIELPVNIQFRLTKPRQVPVFLNGGFSMGYLASTNALHYDGNYGVYYRDDALFRKFQFGFQSGLSIQLFSRSRHPLELGPQINYKLSNLVQPKYASSKHLFSGGLTMKWYWR